MHQIGRRQVFCGENLTDFVYEYTLQLSEQNNGRLYGSYGLDQQGYSMNLKTDIGNFYIGILFEAEATKTLKYLFINILFLTCITAIMINIFINSLLGNIRQITAGFQKIIDNTDTSTLLPIIQNDEMGDLAQSFNSIQKLNSDMLNTIQDNQAMLVEKERLASLGQMIGGIAHNLKTPIFSISGGLEGLNDLINEFDSSIEDPNVNDKDMHDIAKDMSEWIKKLKSHTSYMSDVITAVKGQASILSDDTIFSFTIEELFKQVNILMRHELEKALITLETTNNIDNELKIEGNINSLVQVINNIISNAIEAYNGKTDKQIYLSSNLEDEDIVIKVKDNGPGISEEIKDKLFKEMVTTKGKNGTGLGMFMSYSTIKAHFHGEMLIESELNVGTTFIIKIPKSNENK